MNIKPTTSLLLAIGGLLLSSASVFGCDETAPIQTSQPAPQASAENLDAGPASAPAPVQTAVENRDLPDQNMAARSDMDRDMINRAEGRALRNERRFNTRFEGHGARGDVRGGDANAPEHRMLNAAMEPLNFLVGHWNIQATMRNPDFTNQPAQQNAPADNKAADLKSGQSGTFTVQGFQAIWPALFGNGIMGRMMIGSADQKFHMEGHMVITAPENGSATAAPGDKPQNVSASDNKPAQNVAADKSAFNLYWTDSQGHTCFSKDASWDGTNFTSVSEENLNGKNVRTRVTWTKVAADRVDVTKDVDTGSGWTRIANGTMTRTAGPQFPKAGAPDAQGAGAPNNQPQGAHSDQGERR